MKNLGKLALLGAAIAVSASAAHAASYLTGNIIVSDSPVTFSGSGGVFNLTAVTNGIVVGPPPTIQPGITGGAPALGNYYLGDQVNSFTSTQAPGAAIWSGYSLAGDKETFYATSFAPEVLGINGDYSIVVMGYFVNSGFGASLLQTSGYDNVTYDSTGKTSIQESLVATPTPEPNSLMLLGTGLISGAGMLMRRRRMIA